MCIKGHPSSDSGPSKENSMKRVQIQDDEEAKCQRWWGAQTLREQAVCELSSSQESSSTQSVKEILRRKIEQKRVQQKMKSVFLDRKIMLLFRIRLRSCQISVIFLWSAKVFEFQVQQIDPGYTYSGHKACVICRSRRLRQITQTSASIIHDIRLSLIQ